MTDRTTTPQPNQITARDIILKWAKELGGSVYSFELMLDQHAHELAQQQRAYQGEREAEEFDLNTRSHSAQSLAISTRVHDVIDLIDPETQR